MNKYLDRDQPGKEKENTRVILERPRVKNQYCPVDGHYCEQPQCENCNFEKGI